MAYQLQQAASAALGANGYAVCHDGTQLWVACDDFSIKRCTYNESTDTITIEDSHSPMSGTTNAYLYDMLYNGNFLIAVGRDNTVNTNPIMKVFQYTGGALVELDEDLIATGGAYAISNAFVCTDGTYYYATYTSGSNNFYAYSVNNIGQITRIASKSAATTKYALSADSSFLYIAFATGTAVYRFNGSVFSSSAVATLRNTYTSYGVVAFGNNYVALTNISASSGMHLYRHSGDGSTWTLLDTDASLSLRNLHYDGTYIYGNDITANTIRSVEVVSDVLTPVSSVAYTGGGDLTNTTWWKNKIFTVDGGSTLYAYKNAITGLASVTPTTGAAPLSVAFSVT